MHVPNSQPRSVGESASTLLDALAGGISKKNLAQLCDRIGTALHAGVDMLHVFRSEASRGPARQRAKMQLVHDRIRQGDTLAEAFRRCDGYFPSLVRDMVDVGEQTGRIEAVFQQLAEHYREELSLRRTFLATVAWPVLQLLMAILAMGFLIWLTGLLGANQGIMGFKGNGGALKWFVMWGVLFAVVALFIQAMNRGWLGPLPMAIAMRIPKVGSCLRTMALARLAWTMAMALEAGMDARRVMKLALRSTQNVHFTSLSPAVDAQITAGREFHEALAATRAFPDEFLSSLEMAEISGTQSESMIRLAREYRERANSAFKILAMVAGGLVWLAIIAMFVTMIMIQAMKIIGVYNEALKPI